MWGCRDQRLPKMASKIDPMKLFFSAGLEAGAGEAAGAGLGAG